MDNRIKNEADLRTRLKLRGKENVRLLKIEKEVQILKNTLDHQMQDFSKRIKMKWGDDL
jgi:hypothetical protein